METGTKCSFLLNPATASGDWEKRVIGKFEGKKREEMESSIEAVLLLIMK